MTTFDHLKLVRRDLREVTRYRRYLSGMAGAGCLAECMVEHEADDSCCRREPWNVTLDALLAAFKIPGLALLGRGEGTQP
jgi:hypothetical protein